MNHEAKTLHVMLAELDRLIGTDESWRFGTYRITKKDLAYIMGCNVGTVSQWLERLGCNQQDATRYCAPFLFESWIECQSAGRIPHGKTKAVAAMLGLHVTTIKRVTNGLNLVPIILRHPILRFPIHFWTFAQVKAIAARTGRLNLLTTNQHFAARRSSSHKATTAQRPRVGRSRHRHTRNFSKSHDDSTD